MNELDTFYDEVSKVAYDLFEKRGNVHGHDMADWLKSEIIVKKRYSNNNDQATQIAGSHKSVKTGKSKK